MRQLLTWCGTRALGEKPPFASEDSNARLAGMQHTTLQSCLLTPYSKRDTTATSQRLFYKVRAIGLVQSSKHFRSLPLSFYQGIGDDIYRSVGTSIIRAETALDEAAVVFIFLLCSIIHRVENRARDPTIGRGEMDVPGALHPFTKFRGLT